MHIIKSVGVLSLAKTRGLVYGCMGLLFAPFSLFLDLIGSMAGQGKSPFAGIFGVGFRNSHALLYGPWASFRARSVRCSTTSSHHGWVALSWRWTCGRRR
jgi:hypothetical protein